MSKKALAVCFAASAFFWACGGALAYSTTVEPVADTWLDEDSKNSNYGSSYYLNVETDSASGDPDASALIKFALPTLPSNAVVDSARVLLYYCARNGFDTNDWLYVGLYAVEPNSNWPRDWKEMEATWRLCNASLYWDIEGCESIYYDREANYDDRVYFDYSTSFGYKTWIVTNRVRMWYSGQDVNRGWLVRTQSNNDPEGLVFYSREYSPSYRPKLVIDYSIIPEPSGIAALSAGLISLLALWRRRAG